MDQELNYMSYVLWGQWQTQGNDPYYHDPRDGTRRAATY